MGTILGVMVTLKNKAGEFDLSFGSINNNVLISFVFLLSRISSGFTFIFILSRR